MPFSKAYREKLITAEEAVQKIASNDEIIVGDVASEPSALLGKLHIIRDRVQNVSVVMILPLGEYDFYTKPEMKGHFLLNSMFHSAGPRKAERLGTVAYNPTHLHNCITKRLTVKKPTAFFGQVAPMDKHGYFCLSLGLTYEKEALENADMVILEVNENLPRTGGDTHVHIRDVDFVVENTRPIPALPPVQPTEKDKIIGRYIAGLVEDGSTIQLGIGGISNAAALYLTGKKDLGVHTEMLSDAIVDLVETGVVTGKRKTIWKDKIVAAFVFGSKKIYDFIDGNPAVELHRGSVVNDPYIVGQNYKMVSINTTLEVDLAGQCCSESIGVRQYSGTGGAADTAVGAQRSPGGKSIVALYATAKNDTISAIVPVLSPGAAVTLSRNDVDYVVTEYGVAHLRGCNVSERAGRLIAIANPQFRETLREEAQKNGLL
ncbi:MAG TPA: acetyl-CoA hydrolase/transferase C-terminal domain-containing protein [Negativicutes bacterium]|nr:acetyl-CoA hydrolase/transferase C-terminal domain-containing protein [Negativicutes bacterium]